MTDTKKLSRTTTCPNCSAAIVNVQGFVTCGTCGWNGGI